MVCAACQADAELGALCRACARVVAPCDGLIREHLRSSVPEAAAEAWMVDGFGSVHPVVAPALLGRGKACKLMVLAPSVSREHAELRRAGADWHLRDLGSRNGTAVDGGVVHSRTPLRPPTVVRLGDVALWFVTALAPRSLVTPSVPTGSGRRGVQRLWLRSGDVELCVVGGGPAASGGALLARTGGAAWTERALPRLEYQLLRTLGVRARDDARSPAAVRGCVTTDRLARDLPFHSPYPGPSNVRQVLRRLRAVLADVGAGGLLAAAPGGGYYLAGAITSTPPSGG